MIAQLIAIGILSSASSPEVRRGVVNVPAERTAIIPRVQANSSVGTGMPYGAVECRQPYDPADRAPVAFDFSQLLETGEQVGDVLSIRLGAAAPSLGITVDVATDYSPMIDNVGGQKVQLNLIVAEAQREAASYLAAGVRMSATMWIETTAAPPNYYERTIIVPMRQL